MKRIALYAAFVLAVASLFACLSPGGETAAEHYRVLPPVTQGSLAVYPVVSQTVPDTSRFLTLDEGIRSGKVTVTEMSQQTGLVRPRTPAINDGVWRERPFPEPPFPMPQLGPRIDELALLNSSDSPLLLLAGEMVTGGKQDRIVAQDRIVPAHGGPVSLGVFCVEPGRWVATSGKFGSLTSAMAQPTLRIEALASGNQQQVWAAVGQLRERFAAQVDPSEAAAIAASSSYANAVQSEAVKRRLDSIATPLEHSYDQLVRDFRLQRIVGAVVAVNGELIWADVFASPTLLEKYWPKLMRSYAAEAMTPRIAPTIARPIPTPEMALNFLTQLSGNRENIENEPGVYRHTQISGPDFEAFFLTSLLPNTGFDVHIAKMKRPD